MQFNNKTPFPAIRWYNVDKNGREYNTIVVRVKFLFESMNKQGLWTLKLDNDQEELFKTDIFYGEVGKSSVRFESDFIAYKPNADLIINANAQIPYDNRTFFTCGTKVIRYDNKNLNKTTLLEKHLRIYGKRYWKDTLFGWDVGIPKTVKKLPIQYNNAYGGVIVNPNYNPKKHKKSEEYLEIYLSNPIGEGLYLKNIDTSNGIKMPQIESFTEPIIDIDKRYTPHGFGFIHRSWEPRLSLAGTFDEEWKQNKHPIMPDDYQEQHNNAAHEDLQLKDDYFKVNDTFFLKNLLIGKSEQAFKIPGFYFKGAYNFEDKKRPFFLELDTVVVDILDDDMANNAVYLSYRRRVPHMKNISSISLEMIVSEKYISGIREEKNGN